MWDSRIGHAAEKNTITAFRAAAKGEARTALIEGAEARTTKPSI
jgi:hypothetical protein